MGKTPSRNRREYWSGENIIWISISDLSAVKSHVITNSKEHITQLAVDETGIKPIPPPNTVVMSFKLSIGKVAITTKISYTNEAIIAFLPKNNINISPLYLYYSLQSYDWSQSGNRAVMGKTLNKATLKLLPFCLHAIDEQKQICAKLSLIDAAISIKTNQLVKLDKLIKSQFVLMFGDAGNYYLYNKIVNITDVAKDIFAGGDKPKDFSSEQNDVYKHPVYSNGEKNSGLLCYSKTARVYDVALTVSARGTLGFSVIRNKPFTPVVRLITIIPNNKCNITYLKYCLDTVGFASSGTSQGQITVPDFKSRKIPLPSMDNQIQFENIIKRIDKSKFVELIMLNFSSLKTKKGSLATNQAPHSGISNR